MRLTGGASEVADYFEQNEDAIAVEHLAYMIRETAVAICRQDAELLTHWFTEMRIELPPLRIED